MCSKHTSSYKPICHKQDTVKRCHFCLCNEMKYNMGLQLFWFTEYKPTHSRKVITRYITSSNGSWTLLHVWSLRLGSSTVVCHSYCTTICTGWMFLSGCSTSWWWWSTIVWDGEPRRTSPITACRSPRFLVASICDPPVAVNSSFLASVAAHVGLKTHQFEWHCVSFSALAVFSRNALYKSTFYLLTYLLTWLTYLLTIDAAESWIKCETDVRCLCSRCCPHSECRSWL